MSTAPALPKILASIGDEADALRAPQSLAHQTSVIIVAYNAGHFLRDCVASVLRDQPDAEVIVVDNASTDRAVEHVQAEFPTVRIVRNAENTGFGAGNNVGAAHAAGALLVFLNPDAAVITPGWLDPLVRPLVEDGSVGLVTPKVLLRDNPDRINVAGIDVHLSGISMCRGLGSPRTAYDQTAETAAVSGVAFAIRRDVFEALGGFDEDFFLYLEDVDLSMRAWLAGYRCLYVPHAQVLHDYEITVDTPKTFYVERGRYLMLLKSLSWPTLLGLLPTLLLAEVITWGWLLWRNPKAVVQKLRAYHWLLAHRTRIAEKRRRVQARRICPDSAFMARCQWRLCFEQLAGPRMARAAEIVFGPFLRLSSRIAQLTMERDNKRMTI
jgi:GT2 family glycosyltransferase